MGEPQTKQQTFDTVARFLKEQGGPSLLSAEQRRQLGDTVDGTTCAYRGEGGRKCAAGCLIPDDRYDPSMEGKAAGAPATLNGLGGLFDELGHDTELIRRLQYVHDISANKWSSWAERMQFIAIDFKLDHSVLT